MPNNELTNSGVVSLVPLGFPKLQLLRVDGSGLNDEGLQQLLKLPALRNLHVIDTAVTESGVERAREARPALRVYRTGLVGGM